MAISRKRKLAIAGVVAVVLVVVVVSSRFYGTKEGEPVQAGKVENRPRLESKVTASGDIRPVKYYDLTAEVAGRVDAIYVSEGDEVKKGQPLVKVDPTQYDSQVQGSNAAVQVAQAEAANQQVAIQQAQTALNQARANLDAAKANQAAAEADLERSQAELKFSKSELDRYAQLLEAGLTTKSTFEQYKSRYDQQVAVVKANQSRVEQLRVQVKNAELGVKDAELGVDRAEAGLRSSRARIDQNMAQLLREKDQLNKTVRLSPIDGVVSYLPVKVGQYALSGFSTTPLLTVADMSDINAEIKVDETDIADVQVGQKAKIKVDALGDVEIEGEVKEKGASAVTRSGQSVTTQTANTQEAKDFIVKIKLMPSEEIRRKLRPGMSATAVITTATVENALAVPLQAIVPREVKNGEDGGQPGPGPKKEVEGVFLLENGRAKFTPVTTGIKGDQEIEVKSGLSEGAEIITGPYKTLRTLKDGDAVKRETGRPGGPANANR